MAKRDELGFPEVFVSTQQLAARSSRLAKEGKLRKIGPKLYTTNLSAAPETIVSRNLWHEFKVLDKLIGARLQSKDSEDLFTAPTAIAYVLGESYEPAHLETFEAQRAALAVRVHTDRADDIRSGDALNNIAFSMLTSQTTSRAQSSR